MKASMITQVSMNICFRMGYEGLMKKRTDDYSNEGEATFFRTSRFTVVDRQSYSMAELANKV